MPKNPDVQIYGRPDCGFTISAASLAEDHEHMFGRMQLFHKSELTEDLASSVPASHTTVPIVFVGGKFIGGFTEFENYVTTQMRNYK